MKIINNGPNGVATGSLSSVLVGYMSLRTQYNASVNAFPTTGGRGTGGTPIRGDAYYVTTGGVLGGVPVPAGQLLVAIVNTPGQTAANWLIMEAGYAWNEWAETTINITGLTTINMASYTGYGIINLTSTNATETIDNITGLISNKRYVFRSASGLIVMYRDINVSVTGNLRLKPDVLSIDGTNFGFVEMQLRGTNVFQLNAIDTYNPAV